MLRKILCAAFFMTVSIGLVAAEEFTASITKVDGNKVTFQKMKKGKADGEPMTLPTSADAKVSKGTYNKDTKKVEAGDAIESGLKNEMFSKVGEKGVTARITTDADNKHITAIVIGGGKKKKDN